MEETSRRATEEDPSPRTDRHAIDVVCTMMNKKITVYKLHWQNMCYKLWLYMKCVDPGEDLAGQVVLEPHDRLSTMVTWKRAGHTRYWEKKQNK